MKIFQHKILLSMLLLGGVSLSLAGAFYFQPNLLSNHPFLKELAEKLGQFQQETQAEKVYLQLDKKLYEPNEDIWFSAYVRDAQTFQASSKSRIVYVQLLSPKGSILQELNLITQKGKAAGIFHLDKQLKGGIYTIKAYTKWQQNTQTVFERQITVQKAVLPHLKMKLNFDNKAYGAGATVAATLDLNTLTSAPLAHYVFNYVVSIAGKTIRKADGKTDALGRANVRFDLPKYLNSNDGLLNIMIAYQGQTESISRSIPIVLGNIDLAFYPEGGELVEGMIGGVAFKAVDEFGKPADIKGKVYDQNDKIVATLESYHQGMGKFEFAPQKNTKYFAKITAPANISKIYELPTALPKGYTINIRNQTKKEINLEVISTENESLFLVAQSRNKIYFSKEIKAEAGLNLVQIPTQSFPIGISQITLFDSKKIERAERLVFLNSDKKLTIKVSTDKQKYLPREKVTMTLRVTDERGLPVAANLSLAVVDDKVLSFADDKQGHILSQMLLESDLQGKIEEPNFYFDDENNPTRLRPEVSRNLALDYLLMTQGWRKFEWEAVQNGTYPAYSIANEPALLAGTILDTKGQAIRGATIEVAGQQTKVISNTNGKFSINDFLLYEAITLQISAPGYISVRTNLDDYNANQSFTLEKERTLKGLVINTKNKRVANATVYINSQYATTNARGEFTIKVAESVSYLNAYANGYQSTNVTVLPDASTLKIVLNENPTIVKTPQFGRRRMAKKNHAPVPMIQNKALDADAMVLEDGFVEEEVFDEVGAIAEEVAIEREELPVIAEMDKEEDLELKLGIELDEAAEDVVLEQVVILEKKEVAKKRKMKIKSEFMDRKVPIAQLIRYNRVRAFAVVDYSKNKKPMVRTDFRKTIYWNPNIAVGKDGKATFSFYNSDAVTQFRVTAEGFGVTGDLGRVEYQYFTQLPFQMTTKVPARVLTGDLVNIPLTLTNNTKESINGKLNLELPSHLELLKDIPATITLAAKESKTIFLHCKVLNKIAGGVLSIAFKANGLSDKMSSQIIANPRGFPVQEVWAGDKMKSQFELELVEPIKGSVVAKVQIYPSVLDEVMSGMESMLRMPGGCFEQTSSSNYPNLLVLDYLRETKTSKPALERQAKEYLKVGYQRLTGYESKGGGFDWWGRNPAHEALSAYGLMQFVDMQAVYSVSPELIDRTAKWLLSRKNEKGSWDKNPTALHSWAVAEVTDAYIVWAVCEAGYSSEIKAQIDKSYNDAIRSEDPYMMALVANALYVAKDKRAKELVKELSKLQQKDGSFVGLTSSVTNSTGQSLKVETTSLATLAMLKTGDYKREIQAAIAAIKAAKSYYGYGSTQGTVLALKSLLEYAKESKKAAEDGELVIYVNNQKVETLAYKANQTELLIPNIAKYLKVGKQKIMLQYENTKTALPFDVQLTYNTRVPQSSAACKLALSTSLPASTIKMGETIRLTTTLTNTLDKGQPMTMAMVGIPAGLSLQPWQLKELQEKKVFDYYELFEGYVVFHYEQLKANESKIVHLDLKADIPGDYEAPASSAFLYYTNEHKVWATPQKMTIN